MNEQDSFFERTEQQILFYLYDNRDHAVSKTELQKNIDTAPAESTLESILSSSRSRSSSSSIRTVTWQSPRRLR